MAPALPTCLPARRTARACTRNRFPVGPIVLCAGLLLCADTVHAQAPSQSAAARSRSEEAPETEAANTSRSEEATDARDDSLANEAARTATAHQLFVLGQQALADGRLRAARDLFRRSARLAARPATLFNLALTMLRLGQTVRALRVVDRLLAGRAGPLSEESGREARRLRQLLTAEIARLEIRLHTPERAKLTVDGESPRTLMRGRPLQLRLAPGPHTLALRAHGFVPRRDEVVLAPGERKRLDFHLEPAAEPAIRPVWKWTLVGVGAAVLAAGAVAVGLLLARDGPRADPVWGEARLLRRGQVP